MIKKSWRGLLFTGIAVQVLGSVVAPGCGSTPEKRRVPTTYNSGDAGASGQASAVAGSPAQSNGGDAGASPVAGAAGIASEEAGAAGAGGAAGAPSTGGSGGAVLSGCALGEACCANDQCEAGLACLGAACSCVADLSNYYMLRTDGVAFLTLEHETAQSPVVNADTGLPLHGITSVMGSLYHGCAALDSGEVRCWPIVADASANSLGQLGNGTVGGTYARLAGTLVKVDSTTNLSNVVSIGSDAMNYAAATATCAATKDGSAYCWGDGSFGLIPGVTTATPFATQIKTAAAGPPLSGVTQVSVGHAHACAISNGKVRCWALTGTAPATPYPSTDLVLPGTVLKVVAGYSVSCALTSNDGGAVYCWGDNAGGKLGVGDPATAGYGSDVPVRVRISADAFLNDVTDIAASYGGACVVRSDHTLLCWGNAMYYATPMAVGGVVKKATNVAITDAVKVSTPNDSTIPRYVTTSGVEYSEGMMITPNCSVQE